MKNQMEPTPPEDVWLEYSPGLYEMRRTDRKDECAVRYVLGASHDEALAYIERMTGENNADPISVLVDLRFALGDNGRHMIPDLIEYAAALRADAEKWRAGANV